MVEAAADTLWKATFEPLSIDVLPESRLLILITPSEKVREMGPSKS